MYLIASTAEPTPEAKHQQRTAAAIGLLMGLALIVAVTVVIVLIRFRTYRRRVAAAIGLREETGESANARKARIDPWLESARRMEVEPRSPAEEDTAEFDIRDLNPDDIEPGDEQGDDPSDGKDTK